MNKHNSTNERPGTLVWFGNEEKARAFASATKGVLEVVTKFNEWTKDFDYGVQLDHFQTTRISCPGLFGKNEAHEVRIEQKRVR